MFVMFRYMGVRIEFFFCYFEVDMVCRRFYNGKLMIEKKKKGCVGGRFEKDYVSDRIDFIFLSFL